MSKVAGPGVLEVMLTEGGTETVYVQFGATILKSEEDDDKQQLVPFNHTEVGDSLVYFGLTKCPPAAGFDAYVVVLTDEMDEDEDDDWRSGAPQGAGES